MALCRTVEGAVVCRPVHVGALFAPSQDFHIRAPHPLSFLFIWTLHWCNHCTGQQLAPIFTEISIDGAMENCGGRSSLQARTRRCAFCTEPGFPYSITSSPKLPFHMHLPLVQSQYRAIGSPDFTQISTDGPTQDCGVHSSL